MKRNTFYTIVAAVLFFTLSSCVKETGGGTDGNGDETTVRLTFSLPSANGGAESRAITPTPGEENQINTIDVLALIQRGSDWVYNYTATVVSREITNNSLTVTATVQTMPTAQQFVIIANASDELAAAIPIRYEKIEKLESRIVCDKGGGQWNAKNNGAAAFDPIPMYARTDAETVDAETNNEIGTYPMLRMLARINVTLESAVDNFILEDACLFNYRTAGYVSYGESGFNGNASSEPAVSTPAVPADGDHTGTPILPPTVFYASDKSEDARGTILNSIYTFESHKILTAADKTKGTALVVGGYYDGETEKMSYYRIDIKTTDDATATISSGILRNHSYNVEIQSVDGDGYDTALEAYLGATQVINVIITGWDDEKVIETPL